VPLGEPLLDEPVLPLLLEAVPEDEEPELPVERLEPEVLPDFPVSVEPVPPLVVEPPLPPERPVPVLPS